MIHQRPTLTGRRWEWRGCAVRSHRRPLSQHRRESSTGAVALLTVAFCVLCYASLAVAMRPSHTTYRPGQEAAPAVVDATSVVEEPAPEVIADPVRTDRPTRSHTRTERTATPTHAPAPNRRPATPTGRPAAIVATTPTPSASKDCPDEPGASEPTPGASEPGPSGSEVPGVDTEPGTTEPTPGGASGGSSEPGGATGPGDDAGPGEPGADNGGSDVGPGDSGGDDGATPGGSDTAGEPGPGVEPSPSESASA